MGTVLTAIVLIFFLSGVIGSSERHKGRPLSISGIYEFDPGYEGAGPDEAPLEIGGRGRGDTQRRWRNRRLANVRRPVARFAPNRQRANPGPHHSHNLGASQVARGEPRRRD